MLWIKDPKTKISSVTLTVFIWTAVVGLTKVLLSGNTIGTWSFGTFTGLDFAALMSAVSGLYGWRKKQEKDAAKASE